VATRPDVVVSFYFEGNDLTDASNELKNPVLQRYFFEPRFTQDLRANAERIDVGVRRRFDELYDGWLAHGGGEATLPMRLLRLAATRSLLARAKTAFQRARPPDASSPCHAWWRNLRLSQIALGADQQSITPTAVDPAVEREMRRTDEGAHERLAAQLRRSALLLAASRYVPSRGDLIPSAVYGSILSQLDALIRGWGGKLVLVYLPAVETARHPECDPNRELIRDLAVSRRIPFIDVTDAFARRTDLDAAYRVHLTPLGCRLVGEYVFGLLPTQGHVSFDGFDRHG
jgi:hypothetical protein